jgi:hypothetical protein
MTVEFSSGEMAAQQFPDYGPAPVDTTAGLPFTTGPEPISEAPATPASASFAPPSATDFGASYGLQRTGATGLQGQAPADFGPTRILPFPRLDMV